MPLDGDAHGGRALDHPPPPGLVVFIGFSPGTETSFAHAYAARGGGNLASGLRARGACTGSAACAWRWGRSPPKACEQYGEAEIERWRRRCRSAGSAAPGGRVADRFLARPAGAYITGTTIAVDGGTDAWGLASPPRSPPAHRGLVAPTSVAVVGASEDQRKSGNWLARVPSAARPAGRLPDQVARPRCSGRRAHRSLRDFDQRPDLVGDRRSPAGALRRRSTRPWKAGRARSWPSPPPPISTPHWPSGCGPPAPCCSVPYASVLDSAQRLEADPDPLPAGSIGSSRQSGNLALELGLLAAPEGLGSSRFASLGDQADLGATTSCSTSPATRPPG